MAEPLVRSHLSRIALAAAGASALVLAAGCVTRTVYVVDDRDEPVAVAPQAAPLPSDPPRGADLAGPEEFYEPLAPYGSWHSHPRYGYVFAPSVALVGAGWRPYTRGHWEYTEWGWTWVSDLPFGWATFHYGNWFYDAGYGWVWVPGTRWAPAWVTWRTGGGYVGWAPMPPGAVYGASYSVYDTAWIFVSTGDFGAPLIYPVIVTGPYYRDCLVVTRPYRATYVVYGSTYYRGPDPDRVRREGGRVVHRPIREVDDDRPTTRPPRGVRVSSASHGGHDGSVGSRRGGRDGDRSRPHDRDDDDVRRPDDGRGNGRGDGRGHDGDRVGRRDDDGVGRGDGDLPGRGDDEGRGRGRDDRPGRGDGDDRDDDRLATPRGPDGRPVGSDGRGGARGDGLGDDLGRGAGRGTVGRDPADDPGLGIVTPVPNPGSGGRDDDGRGRGGDDGDDDDDDDDDGVRANDDVVRPDRGEVRPPSDNPYNGHPGSSGSGSSGNGFGAQSAPSPDGARSGPADSRFGRRLPSRFGSPAAPSQAPRSPAVTPPSRGPSVTPPSRAPANDYRRPTPSPSNGYGRVAPTPSPYPQPSGMNPQRSTPAPRYTPPAPAPRQQPAARSDDDDDRRQQKKKRSQSRKDDGERKRQPRRR